jgi:hypothetical protein
VDTDSTRHHLTRPTRHVLYSSTPTQKIAGSQREGRVASAAPLNLTPPSHMTHSHMTHSHTSHTTFHEHEHEHTHSIAPLAFTSWLLIFLCMTHYEYYVGAFGYGSTRGVIEHTGIITVGVGFQVVICKLVLNHKQAHAHVLIHPSNKLVSFYFPPQPVPLPINQPSYSQPPT